MQDAQFYWKLFLETGAPEAYLSYKTLTSGTQTAPTDRPEEERRVF